MIINYGELNLIPLRNYEEQCFLLDVFMSYLCDHYLLSKIFYFNFILYIKNKRYTKIYYQNNN